jgi:hypothetical protein
MVIVRSARKLIATLLIVLCILSCKRDHRARYVPPASAGRAALTLALDAWEQGDVTHLVLDRRTVIEVIDKHRRAGQLLTNFRILGDVSVDGGRWFEVELQLDRPAQIERVRYCVIGINPLWVFRQPDYEQLAHWDCPVPAGSVPP